MNDKVSFSHAVAAIVCMGFFCPSAWAQGDPSLFDLSLEELMHVTVSARRKVEPLQKTPLTVVVFSEDKMRDLGVKTIKDISKFTPGLSVQGGVDNNTSRFFIRGVGTATPTFGSEQAVPIYIDDIYTPLGIGGNIDFFSIDRVEVINGPQGTIYGRNSLGGAIKVYSKQFSDKTETKVGVTLGSFDQRNVTAEIQTPLIEDKLFFGAAFSSKNNDGIQDNVYTNTRGWQDDKKLYRIRLEARPTNDLTVKYSYIKNISGGAAQQLRARPGTQGLAATDIDVKGVTVDSFSNIHQDLIDAYNIALTDAYAAGLDATKYPLAHPGDPVTFIAADDPLVGDVDNIFSDVFGDNSVDQESHTLNISLKINENVSLKYLGAHQTQFNARLFDIDGGVNSFLAGTEELTFSADSHEVRYEYFGGRYDFSIGAFHYKEDSDALLMFSQPFGLFADNTPIEVIQAATESVDFSALNFQPLESIQDPLGNYTGTNLVSLRNNLRQETESTALYFHLGYSVTESLNLSFGIRQTEDTKKAKTPVGNNDGGVLITANTSAFPGVGNFIPAGGLGQFFTPDSLAASFGVDQDVAGGSSTDDPYGSVGDLKATFKETTVELALDYKLDEGMFVYASFKQGFQGGQLFPIYIPNDSGDVKQETTPIKINSYEIGFKSIFNDDLRWNSSIYLYDWDDLILFQTISVPVTTNTFEVVGLPINSGEATTVGFETNIQYLLTDNITVSAGYSYNDFSLDSAQRFDPQSGENIEVGGEFVDEYVSASPKSTLNIGIAYIQGLGVGSYLRWWGSASWRDKMSVNAQSSFQNSGLNLLSPAQEDENFFSESFTNVTAGITYTIDEWRVDLSGHNLLDERRPEAVVNAGSGFFGTLETYNSPRTWSLSVSYEMESF